MKTAALIFSILISIGSFSQSSDTALFNRRIQHATQLFESNIDSARVIILQNINDAYKNKYAFGYAKSNSQLAHYYFLKGRNDSALRYMGPAIKFARISKDTNQIILMYLQSGRYHALSGNYPLAIEHCLVAQNFADHKRDNTCDIKIAHDVGFVYSNMGLHEKAVYYFKRAFNYSIAKNDTFNMANNTARIGGEFNDLRQYDSGLYYNKKGLALFKSLKHKRGVGVTLTNLNESYGGLKNYAGQIVTIREALKIREELGDQYAIVLLKNLLARCYLNMGDYDDALKMASETEAITISQRNNDLVLENYSVQYRAHLHKENYKEAMAYAQKYIHLKDSIYSTTNLKDISELQTRYETDKKEKEILLLQLEKKNTEERRSSENTRRNLILLSVVITTVLIGLFTILLYRRYKKTNEQNRIIEEQKQVVDQKNKEVIDSINYARTIQQAVIPSEEEIRSYCSDAFVIFKPKSIVSGDFYWCSYAGGYFFLAVADCTGHGVPGAFMSMMGMSFLNEIVNEKGNHVPSAILNELRDKVTASLNKDSGNAEKQDGMDMVLLRLDRKNLSLMFSGANNSAYHLSGTELKEVKGDKMPVGLYYGQSHPFTDITLSLKPNDRIITFTDGLPDQFGGPRNKKFMYRQLETIIAEHGYTKASEFKSSIENALQHWQGPNEQIDDITCLGIVI